MADRPEHQALQQVINPRELLHSYAQLGSRLLARLGPVLIMLAQGAAAGEPDLVELAEVTGRERPIGARQLVEQLTSLAPLRSDITPALAADISSTLDSYEVWDLLVRQRRWSQDRYAAFVGDAMIAALRPELPESQHAGTC